MENKAKIITVAGKGGVGKTSICACIVRLLVEKYPDKKILAIDMRAARDNGLDDDISGILDLQDAIKGHREIAYLCDGSDVKPGKEGV